MNSKIKKSLIIFFSIVVLLVVLVIAFLSPIAKYLIEKYDVKYTGREIKMDLLYVNPFTGNIYFRNLKIYELKSDSVFFSSTGLTVNFEVAKLLSKKYEISELTLTDPKAIIVQNGNLFNFSDLLNKFAADSTATPKDTSKAPVQFNILDVTISGGEFWYDELKTPVHYSIKNFEFKSPGKYWNQDTVQGQLSFVAGVGRGKLSSKFNINIKSLDYKMSILVEKFDLTLLQQYLQDISKYGSVRALVDADLQASGNFNHADDVDSKGHFSISGFHLAKTPGDDYASFGKLSVGIVKLNPKDKKYLFDTISLDSPYFKFEQYDYLNNIERMFGEKGASIKTANGQPEKFNLILQLATYIKELSKNFLQSYYKVNRLAITDGNIVYNDFSLSEKFTLAARPLSFIADSIDKNNKRAKAVFRTGLKPYGNVVLNLSMNPKDEGDFDLNFKLTKVPAPMFNPYLITFTSFPLDRGTIEMNAAWNVRNGHIQSDNHLLILDPRVTKKIKKQDTKWIPMPLIMSFVRERGNVIDYSIPITGDLNDPNFHLHDVIFDILKNIFVKPATTPYRMEVKDIEREVEKSLTLVWRMQQVSLTKDQRNSVEEMAKFLKDNPEASLTVNPIQFKEKEKEYLLLYEAKKRFFLAKANKKKELYTEDDSAAVEKMSIKDAEFVKFLDNHVKDSMIFTVQQKARQMVGNETINKKYKQLEKEREKDFVKIFKENGTDQRLNIRDSKGDVPFIGFSYYRISYQGDIPESLQKAFNELREKNEEGPRKKYQADRKNIFQKIFKK